MKILDDERQVFAFSGHIFRVSDLLLPLSLTDMDIGNMPTFD